LIVAPGDTFETFSPELGSGLVGTVGVRVRDSAGNDAVAHTTAGISADVTVGSTAIYRVSLTAPTTAAQYWIIWDNGSVLSDPIELVVTSSTVPIVTSNTYVTRDEVKTAADLSSLDYADQDIDRACTAVSRALDEVCRGRSSHFYQSSETRYYDPSDWNCSYSTYETRLAIDDLVTASSVTIDTAGDGSYSTTWTQNTDFYLAPRNAANDGWPYEELVIRRASGRQFPTLTQYPVKITGTFGWPSVPIQVSQYALIYVTQMVIRTRQAPLGVLTQSLDSGGGIRISKLDPDFDRMCGQFVRQKLFI